MTQNNLELKRKWHSVLLAFSGWSFWVLYFTFYAFINLANYFSGTLCNLGILSSSLICKSDQIEADGGWAGVTPLSPYLLIGLFLVLLGASAFIKNRFGHKVEKIDYFDSIFKLICTVLLISGIMNSLFYIVLLLILFFIIRGTQLFLAKIRSRKTTRMINNRIQFAAILFLFFVFFFVEASISLQLSENIYGIDAENYIDCCKHEVLIGDQIFKTKENPPLCIYEKSRQKKEVCKLNNPISRSILEESVEAYRRW